MEIPKHYDIDEVHDFLCRKAPIDTTYEFAAWLTVEFQKAFNKGWQMSVSQPTVQADAKLSAIIDWLEKNQPDVFRHGIWDAIRTA